VCYLLSEGYIFQRIFNERLVNLSPETMQLLSEHRVSHELVGMTTLGYYLFQWQVPIDLFISSGWVNIFLGVGAQYLLTTTHHVGGDFGFGSALLASGLVWMVALVTILFASCISALRLAESGSNDRNLWSVLASYNGLITLLWLFSTVHYNQAFSNPGGIMLFALHLALTIYCRKRYRMSPDSDAITRRIPI